VQRSLAGHRHRGIVQRSLAVLVLAGLALAAPGSARALEAKDLIGT